MYKLMCKYFVEGDNDEYIFAIIFLILELILMLQQNVVDCHANNIFRLMVLLCFTDQGRLT